MKVYMEEYELEALIGDENLAGYDYDAILSELTDVDYTTGNRYWKGDYAEDFEAVNQVIARHALPALESPEMASLRECVEEFFDYAESLGVGALS